MQDVQEIRNTCGIVGVKFNMKGTVGCLKLDNTNDMAVATLNRMMTLGHIKQDNMNVEFTLSVHAVHLRSF
jgi:hypothetical protein